VRKKKKQSNSIFFLNFNQLECEVEFMIIGAVRKQLRRCLRVEQKRKNSSNSFRSYNALLLSKICSQTTESKRVQKSERKKREQDFFIEEVIKNID
jgi:hypothetical protein